MKKIKKIMILLFLVSGESVFSEIFLPKTAEEARISLEADLLSGNESNALLKFEKVPLLWRGEISDVFSQYGVTTAIPILLKTHESYEMLLIRGGTQIQAKKQKALLDLEASIFLLLSEKERSTLLAKVTKDYESHFMSKFARDSDVAGLSAKKTDPSALISNEKLNRLNFYWFFLVLAFFIGAFCMWAFLTVGGKRDA